MILGINHEERLVLARERHRVEYLPVSRKVHLRLSTHRGSLRGELSAARDVDRSLTRRAQPASH